MLALRALSDLGPECAFVKLLALLLHAALFHGLGNIFLRFLRARESIMKWACKSRKRTHLDAAEVSVASLLGMELQPTGHRDIARVQCWLKRVGRLVSQPGLLLELLLAATDS